jgi:hypothetical protein
MSIDLHFAYPKFAASTSQSTQPPPPCGAHILLHKQTLHNIRLLSTVYNKTKQNKAFSTTFTVPKKQDRNESQQLYSIHNCCITQSHDPALPSVTQARPRRRPGEFQELDRLVANLVTFTSHIQIITQATKMGPAQIHFTFMREVPASNPGQDYLEVFYSPPPGKCGSSTSDQATTISLYFLSSMLCSDHSAI